MMQMCNGASEMDGNSPILGRNAANDFRCETVGCIKSDTSPQAARAISQSLTIDTESDPEMENMIPEYRCLD